MKQVSFFPAALTLLLFFSCKKDTYITRMDAALTITADTLHFDTVFVTRGSVTQVVKIRNDNDQKIRLDQITLDGGSGSFFHINADGLEGPQIKDIDIEARDSLYVFVNLTIDANSSALPFIVRDSIRIVFNNNTRFIQLTAYGQNAHFLPGGAISENTVWTNDLPYVIQGALTIEKDQTLTLEKGCRLYFAANAPLIVEGTLKAEGNDSTRVYFSGDRLDQPYTDFPGSWPGIYFRETSRDNLLHYAVIKNSYQGIVAEGPSPTASPKLILEECIIHNIYDAGILAAGTSISATNCLISNAGGEGSNNVRLVYGGSYEFTHCTIVSYGNSYLPHKNPVCHLSNSLTSNNTIYTADLSATFTNCIFWGDNGMPENEVTVSKEGITLFDVNFQNCLWKVRDDPAGVTMAHIIRNEDPGFDSINTGDRYFDFRLKENSPAIDQGMNTPETGDLDGKPRLSGLLPDLGAYERQF